MARRKQPLSLPPEWWLVRSVRSFADEDARRLGVALWERSYRVTEEELERAAMIHVLMAAVEDLPDEQSKIDAVFRSGTFCARWADEGFPVLMSYPKYAAAMMATSASLDAVSDIEVHWRAFVVHVPEGLLHTHSEKYDRIRVVSFSHGQDFARAGLSLYESRIPHAQIMDRNATIADVLAEDTPDQFSDKADDRAMKLAKRLVAGLLLSMSNRATFKHIRSAGGVPWREKRTGPPPHRAHMIGSPINLDVRHYVREFVAGRRGMPSVQSMVRGHWKRQVIGVGRTGRKVIWVEPYWRGDEDAPILVHPYRLGRPDHDHHR